MNKIKILLLKGDKKEMGQEYGRKLKNELKICLKLIKEYYVIQHHIPYEDLIECAEEFYYRYPIEYQEFIQSIAFGSGLSLDEVKILNAMELLRSLINSKNKLGACSFINIPGARTLTKSNIIGRNYDYSGDIYKEIAKYLILVILKENNKIPVAMISMPGQIYAITAINAYSLFLEINNAMPSGGFEVNKDKQNLMVNLLIALQNSKNFFDLDKKLCKLDSDFSLVINVADDRNIKSYEYSSFNGKKTYQPEENTCFASTNFYLNKEWKLKDPEDISTWQAVSRRDNLLKQTQGNNYKTEDMMNIMDVKLADGGAKLDYTIYQIIYNPASQDLYLKRTYYDEIWFHVELSKLLR